MRVPKDDALENAIEALREATDGEVVVNTEWRSGGTEHVTLAKTDKTDVAKLLLETGMVLLDARRDTRFEAMVSDCEECFVLQGFLLGCAGRCMLNASSLSVHVV